jgi:hypothetical protein
MKSFTVFCAITIFSERTNTDCGARGARDSGANSRALAGCVCSSAGVCADRQRGEATGSSDAAVAEVYLAGLSTAGVKTTVVR